MDFSKKKKYNPINFHESPFSGSRVVPCGWTDRHDEAKNEPKKNKNLKNK